jgi:NAD-dependent deacetylase
MHLTPQDRLFVLTGAGISAESGLATPEAWEANPELVWRFYSQRRRDALAAQPNAAHKALAKIEQHLAEVNSENFYLCTQNVDDLHERAGSHRIHHMHGSLFQSRCVRCNQPFPDQSFHESTNLPACKTCAASIRPHIVWFGEIPLDMDAIYRELNRATILLVVGTSGSVYPAAGFVHIANQRRVRTIYVGPEEPLNTEAFDEIILSTATEALPKLIE